MARSPVQQDPIEYPYEEWLNMPSELSVQIHLTFLASVIFAVAFILGLRHTRRLVASPEGLSSPDAGSMGLGSRILVLSATALCLALLLWRVIAAGKPSLPMTNHLDAFLFLSLLLTGMLVYFRWTRHLGGLAFFLLPMIAVLLSLGATLAILNGADYQYTNHWARLHILTVVAGSVCFALGCVGGIVYLLAHRQLKHKGLDASHHWIGLPPLASIEKFNRIMIYLGFPLLTVAMITGALRLTQDPQTLHAPWFASPKVITAILAWAVYALLIHVPLAPAIRGQRAAWLSILGFVLFLTAFVAVVWMK